MKEALCTTRRFYSKVKSILIVYRDVKDFVYFILTWQVQYKKHKKVRCWIKVVSSCNGYFDLGKFKLNPRLKTVYNDKMNPLEIYLYLGTYLKLIARIFQYYLNMYSFVSAMIQSLKNKNVQRDVHLWFFEYFSFSFIAANTNWKHKTSEKLHCDIAKTLSVICSTSLHIKSRLFSHMMKWSGYK